MSASCTFKLNCLQERYYTLAKMNIITPPLDSPPKKLFSKFVLVIEELHVSMTIYFILSTPSSIISGVSSILMP